MDKKVTRLELLGMMLALQSMLNSKDYDKAKEVIDKVVEEALKTK